MLCRLICCLFFSSDEIYTRLALEYKYIIRASVNCPDPGMFYKKQNDLHVVQTSEEAHSPHDHEFKGSGRCVECDCFASVPVKNKLSELSITIETGGGKKYRRYATDFYWNTVCPFKFSG